MKKIILVALSIFLGTFLLSSAVIAVGKGVSSEKAGLYHVDNGSSDYVLTAQPYKGHVQIVSPRGENNVLINGVTQGLSPDTEYFVWVRKLVGYKGPYLLNYLPLDYYNLTSFTTDSQGNGNFHYKIVKGDLPAGTYTLQVALNYAQSGQIGYTVAATENNIMITVGK